MKKSLLLLLTLLLIGKFSSASLSIEIEYPSVAFEGVNTPVQLKADKCELPDTLIVNGITQSVNKDEDEATIWVNFSENQTITIQGAEVTTVNDPPSMIPLWTSILPPLIAIFLALIFKEVIFSLVSGIFIGGAIIGFYADGFIGIFTGFFRIIDTYLIGAMNDSGHLSVIVFSTIIGGIVALISRNGGMKGIVNSIVKFANTARNGQLATWFLGIAIFFDDYANSLVVGNTMRAITDKLKVSREKLAYIVDSTAAPVSAIAFVTTWIGAELGYIGSGLDNINSNGEQISEGVYSIFLNSLAYSFYPIFTLFFIFYLVWRGKDYGSMLKAERRARSGKIINPEENQGDLTELEDLEPVKGIKKFRAINAVIPVCIIVFGTLLGLLFTGFDSLRGAILDVDGSLALNSWGDIWANMHAIDPAIDSFTRKLGTLIGSADSYVALLWASLTSLVVAILMTISQKIMNLQDTIETVITGFKTMVPAVLILILAWALALVTDDMHTADFLTGVLKDSHMAPWIIPAFTFILAAFVAFSTGSSWSTMALVYPLILPAAWAISQGAGMEDAASMGIFYNTVSAVLAGAVLGDHCSPISDTTILSSLASGCNHIDHVRTQIPYALTVGAIAVIAGTIPTAFGLPSWLSFIFGFGCVILVIELLGKRPEEGQELSSNSGASTEEPE